MCKIWHGLQRLSNGGQETKIKMLWPTQDDAKFRRNIESTVARFDQLSDAKFIEITRSIYGIPLSDLAASAVMHLINPFLIIGWKQVGSEIWPPLMGGSDRLGSKGYRGMPAPSKTAPDRGKAAPREALLFLSSNWCFFHTPPGYWLILICR